MDPSGTCVFSRGTLTIFKITKLQRCRSDVIAGCDIKMGENFLKAVSTHMLAKLPADYVKALIEHLCAHELTLGTACSGTDAPVFMLRGLTQTLIKQHNGVREMKHVFSCEHDKDKRDWITTVCDYDNDFKLFDDIADIGCAHAMNTTLGRMDIVPTSNMFIAGFSCKSVSRSVGSYVARVLGNGGRSIFFAETPEAGVETLLTLRGGGGVAGGVRCRPEKQHKNRVLNQAIHIYACLHIRNTSQVCKIVRPMHVTSNTSFSQYLTV